MKRFGVIMALIIVCLALLAGFTTSQALPEYSAQTGEPCATCHLSPSGGGSRTVRGQAWVGSGKPGVVPLVEDALELLGINLSVDPDDFLSSGQVPEPPQPLVISAGDAMDTHQWLLQYEGN